MNQRPVDQPGLRLRMGAEGRRIRSQHRQLDLLYERVYAALERGSPAEARAALERFRDAWEAHTSLEDGFYFPALRGLRPALGARLEALSREHGRLRAELEGVAARLARGADDPLEPALDRLAAGISDHEQREEEILAELAPGPAQGGMLPE
jgi:hemerythrin-like domain-containing protein